MVIKEKQNSDALLKHSQQCLDDSVDKLDVDIKDKLFKARRHALNQHYHHQQQKAASRWWKNWLPLTSAAVTATLIIGISIQSGLWQSNELVLNDDLELVTALDNIELYDDLDFYQWLAEDELQAS
ncbi:hypothetical protein MNBD_GAMMA23-909 [hydrothermal vent metagenome]|uniref:DUF3619 family protein n=1 Tax=hydrothermal vent metagenome TaxID=652676 RepID=A0A3B1AE21_9ZZZZ